MGWSGQKDIFQAETMAQARALRSWKKAGIKGRGMGVLERGVQPDTDPRTRR